MRKSKSGTQFEVSVRATHLAEIRRLVRTHRRYPTMRQQFANAARGLGGQSLEDILEVSVRIVGIESGGLNQAHDGSGALARAQRSCKQPVRAPQRDRADPILDPVVVDGQRSVVEEARQRSPTSEAIVDRLRDRRSVGRYLPLQQQPLA